MLPSFFDPTATQRTACIAGGRAVSLGELIARAEALGRAIEQRFDPVGRHTTLGFARDRFAFALGLLGSWSAGRTAMLPEHGRRDALGALALHPATGLFVHDTGTGRGLFAVPFAADPMGADTMAADTLRADTSPLSGGVPLAASRPPDALWAAGRRAVPGRHCGPRPAHPGLHPMHFAGWSFPELEAELAALAEAVGARVDGPVLSTLAPCYAPAALAAVLLPLALGVPFVAEVPHGPAALLEAKRTSGATTLVTSLGHLHGLWALPRGALSGLQLVLVVGSRVPDALARGFAERHGVALLGQLAREPGPDPVEWGALEALWCDGAAEDSEVRRGPAGLWVLAAADPALGERLRGALDTVAAAEPVELRLLDRLARDPNGHMDRADFLRHFGLDAKGSPLCLDFPLASGRRGERRHVTVPKDSAWFDGHFPGYPVLAGAVQLAELVLPALERHLGHKPRVKAWSALKFLAPIQPGDSIYLEFVRAGENSHDFHIQRGDARCTQGRVHCTPLPEGAP